ncbi:CinA family protein [Streptacidiphilus sp. ASG 303]|uniref:CinA family protein n=1 Tax=Streptacidiphilus sp. ASG 303 TaxID=2896847 RepID=UPI001E2ECC00|nr:CinA family protein [Streptacidiphilus sp. ASG 303]MCD0484702.1 CinA family protein [Streptacidiphilus sp. ASG 303]
MSTPAPGDGGDAVPDLARRLHAALGAAGGTVAVAESLTGGLLAAQLVDVPGASRTFRGSVTAYATDLKESVLGVDGGLLAAEGPVHPRVALQMAEGVRRLMGAVYGVATTGVAGPDPQDGRPVGTVHLAVVGPGGSAVSSPVLSGGRATIRRKAVAAALELLQDQLGLPAGAHGGTPAGPGPRVGDGEERGVDGEGRDRAGKDREGAGRHRNG